MLMVQGIKSRSTYWSYTCEVASRLTEDLIIEKIETVRKSLIRILVL
jgi:hypothetical protein